MARHTDEHRTTVELPDEAFNAQALAKLAEVAGTEQGLAALRMYEARLVSAATSKAQAQLIDDLMTKLVKPLIETSGALAAQSRSAHETLGQAMAQLAMQQSVWREALTWVRENPMLLVVGLGIVGSLLPEKIRKVAMPFLEQWSEKLTKAAPAGEEEDEQGEEYTNGQG